MRPLNAVVLAAHKKTGLKIRTESGLITTLNYNKKYHVGEKILVSYDFTRNKVKGVIEEENIKKNMIEIEIEESDEDKGEKNINLDLF